MRFLKRYFSFYYPATKARYFYIYIYKLKYTNAVCERYYGVDRNMVMCKTCVVNNNVGLGL